jgi:hypothetical protein
MRLNAQASVILLSALALAGCATARGAAIGAAGGAAVAAATDNDVEKGAAVGGVAGAVVGTATDD